MMGMGGMGMGMGMGTRGCHKPPNHWCEPTIEPVVPSGLHLAQSKPRAGSETQCAEHDWLAAMRLQPCSGIKTSIAS